MRSMTRASVWVGLVLAALTAAGCGGRAGRVSSGPETFRAQELAGNEAAIYIFRDTGGPAYRLYVNQQDMGTLRSGTYRSVVVTPGEHFVRIVSRSEVAREVVVGPGESAYVRVYAARFHKRQPEMEVMGPESGRQAIARKTSAD